MNSKSTVNFQVTPIFQGLRWSLILPLLLLFTGLVVAQQYSTGTIAGVVQDETGAIIPGADITITHVETGTGRAIISNDQGRYEAPNLQVGAYLVRASLPGFRTSIREGITLNAGRTAVVDIVLQVGEVSEQVTVTGETALVETTTATVSNIVSQQTVENLPLNNRDLTELAYLQPGVLRLARRVGLQGPSGSGNQITVAGRARGHQSVPPGRGLQCGSFRQPSGSFRFLRRSGNH